jgi:hypothetical protein
MNSVGKVYTNQYGNEFGNLVDKINLVFSIAILVIVIIVMMYVYKIEKNMDSKITSPFSGVSDPTLAIFNSQSKLGIDGSRGGPQNWQGRESMDRYSMEVQPTDGNTQIKNGLTIGSSLALRGSIGGPQDFQ